MAADDQEKTEEATTHKREDALKRGQVPRSQDLVSVVVAAVFAMALCASAPRIADAFARSAVHVLGGAAGTVALSGATWEWLARSFAPAVQSLAPVALMVVVAAVVANVAQGSVAFSTEPLSPDISRLSPSQAFERIFSRRSLWELGKLAAKLGVISASAWSMLGDYTHRLLSSSAMSPTAAPRFLTWAFASVSRLVLLILALFAVADLIWSRRDYLRKLRMSKREIKDEHRQREGDPDVRAKRKRLAADVLRRTRSLARVPEADVIVTNPTHVAVALKYRRRTMRSPIVISKGAGDMAAEIRRIAIRRGVPILRSPELARALFRDCALEHPVTGRLQEQLVPIYRWVMGRPGNKVFS
jgi:flagellar biosynthetic protein FlhB